MRTDRLLSALLLLQARWASSSKAPSGISSLRPRGFRTYRVSRIKHAKLLDQPCERPANFDLAGYWKASTAQFRERIRYSAILRLEPQAAEMMKTWGGFSNVDTGHGNPDGWITMRAQFEDEDHACFVVLGLGPRADVLEPAKLRERVAADIDRIMDRRAHSYESIRL